jgi:hypothetical protein
VSDAHSGCRPLGRASLRTVAREWARIGVTGLGGPPAHIALLRRLVVDCEERMDATQLPTSGGTPGHLGVPESRRSKRARPPGAEMMSEDAKFALGF